jgi:catechol 2,3-dioxygenase-like lactoylglutathione lyase family enzyme
VEVIMRQFLFTVGVLVGLATGVPSGTPVKQAPNVVYREGLLIQLGVTNLDRSIAFYTAKLGFRVTERRDDLKFVHLSTNTPGVEIGLNEVAKPDIQGPILNFTVANAAAARTTLEAQGVTFVGETVTIPGKVVLVTFVDPDGHRLRFAGLPRRAVPLPESDRGHR